MARNVDLKMYHPRTTSEWEDAMKMFAALQTMADRRSTIDDRR
jgi:hypothetical protein